MIYWFRLWRLRRRYRALFKKAHRAGELHVVKPCIVPPYPALEEIQLFRDGRGYSAGWAWVDEVDLRQEIRGEWPE